MKTEDVQSLKAGMTSSRKAFTASITCPLSATAQTLWKPEETSEVIRISARSGFEDPSSHQARPHQMASPKGAGRGRRLVAFRAYARDLLLTSRDRAHRTGSTQGQRPRLRLQGLQHFLEGMVETVDAPFLEHGSHVLHVDPDGRQSVHDLLALLES